MEEIEDNFIKAFNNGYLFSKNFPEVAQSINEQNKSTDELSLVNGVLEGIDQGLKEWRDLVNERLNELKDIEKQDNSRDYER